MASIFTSTSLRCPVYLLLLLLTIGYLSHSTEGGGIQCYTCNYDEPLNVPFDHYRCDLTKGTKTCGGADGCVTVHHDVHMTDNGTETRTSHRAGVGTCMESETIKCIESVMNKTLEPGKEINCQESHYDRVTMLSVLSNCFGHNYGSGDNTKKWDITAHFCSCFGKLCNGKGDTPKPPPPPGPPSKGKATRHLFGGGAAMIWTALAAGLMWEIMQAS